MGFDITPEEAQGPARAAMKYLRKQQMEVVVEKPAWADAPYTTTLVAKTHGLQVLVEAQGSLSYSRSLKDLVTWIRAQQRNAQVYVVTHEDASTAVGAISDLKADGVGLLVVDENDVVTEHHPATNPALIANPDPTLTLGPMKSEVRAALKKFNEVNRKDGLRDMCELVEGATEDLGVTGSRKGWLKIPEAEFRKKDWSSQINELARPDAYNAPHKPLINEELKADMQSFRGARNLVDHKVSSRREDARRQRQFTERMVQGPRLVSELLSARRRVR